MSGIALTDTQLQKLQSAVAMMSPPKREMFLKSVAANVSDKQRPLSDSDLMKAIQLVASAYGVSTPWA